MVIHAVCQIWDIFWELRILNFLASQKPGIRLRSKECCQARIRARPGPSGWYGGGSAGRAASARGRGNPLLIPAPDLVVILEESVHFFLGYDLLGFRQDLFIKTLWELVVFRR